MSTTAVKSPDSNILQIGHLGWEAAPEQIIIIVDEFRSGNECSVCLDREHRIVVGGYAGKTESVVDCDNCNGLGKYPKNGLEIRCAPCEGKGKVPCPSCKGTGTTSIATPDDQKDAPTTGVVASIGSNITLYKHGQRLCFTSYSGHGFTITSEQDGRPVQKDIRILVERDVLAIVHGQLSKKDIKRSMALSTNS